MLHSPLHRLPICAMAAEIYPLFASQNVLVDIHSVYQNTINFRFAQQLFALQTVGSPRSPLSLISSLNTSQLAQFQLSQGEQVCFSFEFTPDCHIYSATLQAVEKALFFANFYATFAAQCLKKSDAKGLNRLLQSAPSDDLLLCNMAHYLKKATISYQRQDVAETTAQLLNMLGAGVGLTPSGDDFLCGVLATLTALDLQQTPLYQQLHQAIARQLDRTNDISAAFLRYALMGRFSQAVLDFFALDETAPQTKQDAVFNAFAHIGHSSGMDTLFGIYYMSNLLALYQK